MATLELVAEKPPLVKDEDGVFRVGGTRVRLDTLIGTYQNGCTPEEICFKYPSVKLSDIYAVIAYYLQWTSPDFVDRELSGFRPGLLLLMLSLERFGTNVTER